MQMIEQSYGRYIRKDFLGPLIAARLKTAKGSSWRKNRTPFFQLRLSRLLSLALVGLANGDLFVSV